MQQTPTKEVYKMLILSRRVGEVFMIGDEVQVVVLSVTGGTVRIGINAPAAIAVHREEIYREIQEQKARQRAVSWPPMPEEKIGETTVFTKQRRRRE